MYTSSLSRWANPHQPDRQFEASLFLDCLIIRGHRSNRSGLPESRDWPRPVRVRNLGPTGVITMANWPCTMAQIFLAHSHGSRYRSGRQAQRLEPHRLLALCRLVQPSPKLTRKRSSRTPVRATDVPLVRVPRE